jgi:hypothetical protein
VAVHETLSFSPPHTKNDLDFAWKRAHVARNPALKERPASKHRINRILSRDLALALRRRMERLDSDVDHTTVTGNKMDAHRYKVGQIVHYTSNVLHRFGAIGQFRIVKLLPPEGDEQQYRIKSETEPHERVAKESQLDTDGATDSASLLFQTPAT